MKRLTLSTALVAALLASSAFASSQDTDSPMTERDNAQTKEQKDKKQWDKEKEEWDKKENGYPNEEKDSMDHDGMKGMESKPEQKRQELEEKADHDMLPNTGTDAGYEGGTDTEAPTN